MSEQTERILSLNETAAYFGVTNRAVSKWIKAGYFPNAYRIGLGSRSPYQIPFSDVEAFDARRRNLSGDKK